MFEKLPQHMACWYIKLKHWRIGTFIGTLARGHVNHAVTQARWHVDHVGTQARMARDIANSKTYTKTKCQYVMQLKRYLSKRKYNANTSS